MAIQERLIRNVTAQPQQVRIAPRRGTMSWILQRVSAYGLVLFLTVHMWVNHFTPVTTNQELTFQLVNSRFFVYPVIYAINDIGLLTCALFHGFNGVRNVVYDLVTNTTARRIATALLVILGVILLIDGSLTLLALMRMPV
jgi:succinate dehydrogenase / fumarate reductase membrane anchor subunit